MAKESERPVQAPLLERLRLRQPRRKLIRRGAADPGRRETVALELGDDIDEVPPTRAESLEDLKESLRRDIEYLLNTRQAQVVDAVAYPEAARSMLTYGIPDLSNVSPTATEALQRVAQALEDALVIHEPRLAGVRIEATETDALGAVRFTVEAMLRLDPSPERISFDTEVARGTGDVTVRGGSDA